MLADQRLGAVDSLVVGEWVLVAAQVVLLVQWYRRDRSDDFPDNVPDDAVAYRAMLD